MSSDFKAIVIGTGHMGKIHVRILSNLGALAGVADVNLDAAKQMSELYKVDYDTDYKALIKRVNPDYVIISAPSQLHAKISIDILENFDIKGILIEKPVAENIDDATKLKEIIDKRKIIAIIGHSEVYNPIIDRTLSLLRQNAIGEVRHVVHDRRGSVQPERIKSLGDVFEDIGVHDFDIMARISQGHGELYAVANSYNGIYNAGTVSVTFDNGRIHIVHLSREFAGRRRSMLISGTDGTMDIDLFGQIINVQALSPAESESKAIRLPFRGTAIKVYGEPLLELHMNLLNSLRGKETPKVTIDDGVRAIKLVEATRESLKTKKPVEIDV